jgi:hypothetical protein
MTILTINTDLAKDHYTEKIEENKRISYLIFLTLNLDNTHLFSVVLLSYVHLVSFTSSILGLFGLWILYIDFKKWKQSVSIFRWKGEKGLTQVHLINSIKTAHNLHNKHVSDTLRMESLHLHLSRKCKFKLNMKATALNCIISFYFKGIKVFSFTYIHF